MRLLLVENDLELANGLANTLTTPILPMRCIPGKKPWPRARRSPINWPFLISVCIMIIA